MSCARCYYNGDSALCGECNADRQTQRQVNGALKRNALRIAQQHREICTGESCAISLWLLAELLDLAGIDLTDDERMEFA